MRYELVKVEARNFNMSVVLCLSFSVIRRYFFNAYNHSLKFVRSLTHLHAGKRGVFRTCRKKYELSDRREARSGDFFRQMRKNTPYLRVHQLRANKL